MKRTELFQAVLACAGSFAVVAALGLAFLPAPAPAQPSAPARPASAASSAAPASQSAASSAASAPASAPAPTSAANTFAFTGEEFFQQIQTDLGQEFPYAGSFSDQGVYVRWAAVDGLDLADPNSFYLKLAVYSASENGPAQAVTVDGRLDFTQALGSALRQCAAGANAQDILKALVVAGSYKSPSLQATFSNYSATLLPTGGSLQQAALNQLSWKQVSVVNQNSSLYAQLQKLNIEYRHEELVELLEAALPEDQRAQDPFLPDALKLARRAAALEALCSIDRTVASQPILRYPGAETLTPEICFSPYLSTRGLALQAGFYSAGDAAFTTVELRSNNLFTSDTCDSNDILPGEGGLTLKSSGGLFSSNYSLRAIAGMEAPAARFSSRTDPQLYDHVLTQQELDAFHTLYELYQLKTYIHKRSWTYSSIT
ncbi:hypothetical protein [Allofournierella sp.]|uniref:hypothetical protein n=1 Tax=Allofournierella sp. TaxID=1940256 RepID=UPI003AB73270